MARKAALGQALRDRGRQEPGKKPQALSHVLQRMDVFDPPNLLQASAVAAAAPNKLNWYIFDMIWLN